MVWVSACRLSLALLLVLLPWPVSAVVFVDDRVNTTPSPENFSICSGNTCYNVTQHSLSPHQWQQVAAIFSPRVSDAAQERQRIGQAVALLEKFIGEMTDTASDRGQNASPDNPVDQPMDCIDESTNTTNYLYMMQQSGLLAWHRVEEPVTRGFFFFGWPHTTAVMRSLDDSRLWAIDSWFHDNGTAPEIVPLKQWRDGWKPDL